jgi:Co/Zn/Cd efflux system component
LDWVWADGAISLLVSTLILLSAVPLILQSCQALFEQNLSLENHR